MVSVPGGARPWRLVLEGASEAAGAENMALDHALLESVQAGGAPALRFYGWRPACISFGRNQRARGVFDPDDAARLGVDFVRRPTGGGAVLHDRELTYAVVVPVGELGGPRETYARVNEALAAGLRALGIPAAVAPRRGPDARRGAGAEPRPVCFEAAAPGEIVAHGRKLVGSAQRCEARVILQHGSLLLAGSQRALAGLAGGPRAPAGETTVAELLGYVPDRTALVEALVAGFESALGVRFVDSALGTGELRRAGELAAVYRSAEWTWRR